MPATWCMASWHTQGTGAWRGDWKQKKRANENEIRFPSPRTRPPTSAGLGSIELKTMTHFTRKKGHSVSHPRQESMTDYTNFCFWHFIFIQNWFSFTSHHWEQLRRKNPHCWLKKLFALTKIQFLPFFCLFIYFFALMKIQFLHFFCLNFLSVHKDGGGGLAPWAIGGVFWVNKDYCPH